MWLSFEEWRALLKKKNSITNNLLKKSKKTAWPKLPEQPEELDLLAAELAEKYKPLADEILKEVVRIPEDYVAEDPLCGTSNHEKPRMEYLRRVIIEKGAVAKPEDVDFDEFGNIVWVVQDESDGIPVKVSPSSFYSSLSLSLSFLWLILF